MVATAQLQPATFAEFLEEAKRGNVVAVARTVAADSLDPVDAFVKVAGKARFGFLWNRWRAARASPTFRFSARTRT